MSCLCREGEKRCGWWITNKFSNELKSYCINPNIEIQTRIICGGTQERKAKATPDDLSRVLMFRTNG